MCVGERTKRKTNKEQQTNATQIHAQIDRQKQTDINRPEDRQTERERHNGGQANRQMDRQIDTKIDSQPTVTRPAVHLQTPKGIYSTYSSKSSAGTGIFRFTKFHGIATHTTTFTAPLHALSTRVIGRVPQFPATVDLPVQCRPTWGIHIRRQLTNRAVDKTCPGNACAQQTQNLSQRPNQKWNGNGMTHV
jgi:hypothetical protein